MKIYKCNTYEILNVSPQTQKQDKSKHLHLYSTVLLSLWPVQQSKAKSLEKINQAFLEPSSVAG